MPSTLPIMTWSLIVVLAGCIAVSCGQICQRPATKADTTSVMPKTRGRFQMDVEVYEQENNNVTAWKVWHDRYAQTVHLRSHADGQKTEYFYFYKDNEILIFSSSGNDRPSCSVVNDLSKSPLAFTVGGAQKNATGSNVLFPSAASFFRFTGVDAAGDDIYQEIAPNTTVRGKNAQVFTSCQTWLTVPGNRKFTAKVTHKFLSPEWRYPRPNEDDFTVPLELHVTGLLDGRTINVTYSFFNFKTSIDLYSLETPAGVPCQGRKVDKPFPQLPASYDFIFEVVDAQGGNHYTFQEIYGKTSQLSVYKKPKEDNTFKNPNDILIVNDYLSGLSYKIDQELQTCNIQNVSYRQLPLGRNINTDPTQTTPKQLFYDNAANYTYLGERQVRGIITDTWVAQVDIENFGKSAAVEWYFAIPFTQTSNDDLVGVHPIPVMCKLWPPPSPVYIPTDKLQPAGKSYDTSTTISFFNVDYSIPRFNTFSIKPCMAGTASNRFQMIFQNVTDRLKNCDMQDFKWRLQIGISVQTGVHFLRITDFELFHIQNDLVVQFELLDVPPCAGEAVHPEPQTPLAAATNVLKSLIESGHFIFVGCNQTFVADPNAVVNPSNPVSSGSPMSHRNPCGQEGPEDNQIQPEMQSERLVEPAPPSEEEAEGHEIGSWTVVGIAVFVVGMATGVGGSYYMAGRRGL